MSVRQAVAVVVSLLVLALAGILVDTILDLRDQESDAVVIDLAGRQRMLQERHLQEMYCPPLMGSEAAR